MDKCGKRVTIHANGKTGTGTIVDEVSDAFFFSNPFKILT
jgi:hypothetical protein